MDIISTSAVLHEVYSYGGGYSALYKSLKAVANSLKPNGYYAYRDVFPVDAQSLHERTIHCYGPQSWVRFLKLFTPHYLSNAEHPYHGLDDGLYFRQDSKFIDADDIDCSKDALIEAPLGSLREIQRHYITLRDHVWRSGILGFVPTLDGPIANEWVDKRTGHKRVRFSMTENGNLSDAQKYLLKSISEVSGDKFVVDGDIFDEITDTALNAFLFSVESGNEDTLRIWNEWLAREGSETYAYMTTGQFIGSVALKSIEESDQRDSILLPEVPEDALMVPRDYYNRFLRKRLSNPLFDGKQLILFKKIPLSDTGQIQRGLEVVQQYCPKNMLSSIYAAINQEI